MHADPRLRHFEALTPTERRAAVERLIEQGFADTTIAAATGLALEAVRTLRGQRNGDMRHDDEHAA